MRVNAMRVFVNDLAAARAFYEGVLAWPVSIEDESKGFIGFDLGVTLMVENGADAPDDVIGRFTGVTIWVDDIDAAYRLWSKRGVEFDGPPIETSWGGRLANFKDPSGNTLTIISDVDIDD